MNTYSKVSAFFSSVAVLMNIGQTLELTGELSELLPTLLGTKAGNEGEKAEA